LKLIPVYVGLFIDSEGMIIMQMSMYDIQQAAKIKRHLKAKEKTANKFFFSEYYCRQYGYHKRYPEYKDTHKIQVKEEITKLQRKDQ
jgi:hypothetical protein